MQHSLQNDQISATARLVILGQVLLGQDPNWSHLVPDRTVTCGKHWIKQSGGVLPYLVPFTHQAWFQQFAQLLQNVTIPGLFAHQVLRKRYIDERVRSLVDGGTGQLVVVGGGFDTLALRMSNQYSDLRCFELDRAGMQCIKQSLPDSMHYNTQLVPADLEETSLDRVLRDLASFDTGSRTVFVVEGVSMYLDEQAVRSMLDSIASMAGPARQDVLLTFMDGRPGSCSLCPAVRKLLRSVSGP